MKKSLFYLILLGNLAAIVFLWLKGSAGYLGPTGGQAGMLIAYGRLAGLMAEFFILLQLVLIGRVAWVERQFGHDKLNRFHRWIGYSLIIFLLSHPLLLTLGYSQLTEVSFITQFTNFIKNWEDVSKALLALGLFILVIISSIVIVKKRLRYETWYFTHLSVYVAIALAFGHQINTADVSQGTPLYYWLVLNFTACGLLLVFRWLKPLYIYSRQRFTIDRVVKETEDIYSIFIRGRNLSQYRFSPGQFANLTFLQKGLWFTHPFSFSAAPNGEYLRFSIKALGDFTNQINQLKSGTRVIIDGPLGIFTQNTAKKNKFLLLAGGIGITPLRALAESLSAQKINVVLLYGAKTENDLVFKNELENFPLTTHFVLSQNSDDTKGFETGHLNAEKIKRLVTDCLERDIFLCGPEVMMKFVVAELKSLNIPAQQIHFEKFGY